MNETIFKEGQHHEFLNWKEQHSDGSHFYLNCKTPTEAMLHRSSCRHVPGHDYPGDATRNEKVCHQDKTTLHTWAQSRSVAVVNCDTCKP